MRQLVFTKRFQKDVKLCKKQGRDLNKLKEVFSLLMNGDVLPVQYKDYLLKGNWTGYRDLHIEPDWILIYKEQDETVILLAATGSHAKLLK